MNYHTSTIPPTLAEKLKEKGMPITITEDIVDFCTENEHEELTTNCIYAEVFDWLMEKGINIRIESDWEFSDRDELDVVTSLATDFFVEKVGKSPIYVDVKGWHEAANAAIEKALTLI